jgi:predicted metal-dependent phosphotriesterase family hydrolase
MTFVRTVLVDMEPSKLGVAYAHEHLVIDGGRPVQLVPDFDLGDIDRMVAEVEEAAALGLRAVVDAMPCDAGRNAGKLAELSRRTGVQIVAPTGLHHERYYYLEAAGDIAERIDAVLATGVPAARLTVVPDCGFSQTARWATTAKPRALVTGRDLVLGRT